MSPAQPRCPRFDKFVLGKELNIDLTGAIPAVPYS